MPATKPSPRTHPLTTSHPKQIQDPKPRRHRLRRRTLAPWQWGLIWCGITSISIASATAGAILALSFSSTPLRQTPLSPEELTVFSQDEAIASQSLRFPELNRPVNILLLGTKVLTSDLETEQDTNDELGYHALVNSFEGLADTMLLLRFDPKDQQLSLLSIPRDTQAYIAGYGLTKINHANAYGGAVLAAQTVSDTLGGVEIDRYIRINVQGIGKLIDALGGVTVYIPKDMQYQDDSQHLYINLKKGQQHLNGEEALQFLRFRYDEYGDIGRVQRQQTLIRALLEQGLTPANLVKFPQIMSIIQAHIDTNLSVQELVALAGFTSQLERSQMQMLMLPGGFSGDGKDGNTSYWLPYRNQIHQLMTQHFELPNDFRNSAPEPLSPNSIRVAIQDSTGDLEAVQFLVDQLQEAGYSQVFIANDWPEPLEQTRIVAQGGDDLIAAEMRTSLGLGDVRVESTGVLNSELTIQLGQDWLQLANSNTTASWFNN